MMQQAQDFLEESDAIYALVARLDDASLACVTQFKGWTIADVIGHLHMWNNAADRALTDRADFQAFSSEIRAHLGQGGSLKTFERQWLDREGLYGGALAGRALVEAWRAFYPQMAARFGAADPAARVAWVGPEMSVRSSISARLMESWAHAQAIYDILGQKRLDTDRIRNIVVMGVNTYGWSFKVRGKAAPQPMPYVHLTGPSGAVWEFGEVGHDENIEGSATGFCQVVTQTRNVADVDLTVRGSNATSWMQNAQCFAGPPECPPDPGTRHRVERG